VPASALSPIWAQEVKISFSELMEMDMDYQALVRAAEATPAGTMQAVAAEATRWESSLLLAVAVAEVPEVATVLKRKEVSHREEAQHLREAMEQTAAVAAAAVLL
jgi:hypothetical protein